MKRASLVLLALVALLGGGLALRAEEEPRSGAWTPMAASPLSARHGALAVPVGTQVLLIGGDASPLCSPSASCTDPAEPLRDGAAYDVQTDRWRRVADAPVTVAAYGSAAVVGQTVHLLQPGPEDGVRMLSYDVGADRWSELPLPDHARSRRLLAYDGEVLAVASSHTGGVIPDLVLDGRSWRELPRDPLAPSEGRRMVAAGDRLLLVAWDVGPRFEERAPWLRAAVLEPESRTWTRLPDHEQVVAGNYAPLVWTGSHAVLADPYPADAGGIGSPGNGKPGGGFLDISTGRWAPLPDRPADAGGSPVVAESADYIGGFGLVLDTQEREWIELPEPAGTASYQTAQAWVDGRLVMWGGGSLQGGEPVATGAVWRWE